LKSNQIFVVKVNQIERGWGKIGESFLIFKNDFAAARFIEHELSKRACHPPQVFHTFEELGFSDCHESYCVMIELCGIDRISMSVNTHLHLPVNQVIRNFSC